MQVFQWQMCSDAKLDSHRFMDCIQDAINSHLVKRYIQQSRAQQAPVILDIAGRMYAVCM